MINAVSAWNHQEIIIQLVNQTFIQVSKQTGRQAGSKAKLALPPSSLQVSMSLHGRFGAASDALDFTAAEHHPSVIRVAPILRRLNCDGEESDKKLLYSSSVTLWIVLYR